MPRKKTPAPREGPILDPLDERPSGVADSEIEEKLSLSIAAHMDALMRRRRKQPGAREALSQAAELRVQAHEMDPAHTAEVWEDPKLGKLHDALMAFYLDQGVL